MQLQDRYRGGVKDPGTLYNNFLDLCMAKGSKKRLIDILLKNSEGGLTERILEEIKETVSEEALKFGEGGDELRELYNKYKQRDFTPDKQRDFTPGPIGRPRGKSTKTIQRHNWIRDKYYKFRRMRLAHTLDEFAALILSELKENTPQFFEKSIYKKSTILKVLKNKSWGDD